MKPIEVVSEKGGISNPVAGKPAAGGEGLFDTFFQISSSGVEEEGTKPLGATAVEASATGDQIEAQNSKPSNPNKLDLENFFVPPKAEPQKTAEVESDALPEPESQQDGEPDTVLDATPFVAGEVPNTNTKASTAAQPTGAKAPDPIAIPTALADQTVAPDQGTLPEYAVSAAQGAPNVAISDADAAIAGVAAEQTNAVNGANLERMPNMAELQSQLDPKAQGQELANHQLPQAAQPGALSEEALAKLVQQSAPDGDGSDDAEADQIITKSEGDADLLDGDGEDFDLDRHAEATAAKSTGLNVDEEAVEEGDAIAPRSVAGDGAKTEKVTPNAQGQTGGKQQSHDADTSFHIRAAQAATSAVSNLDAAEDLIDADDLAQMLQKSGVVQDLSKNKINGKKDEAEPILRVKLTPGDVDEKTQQMPRAADPKPVQVAHATGSTPSAMAADSTSQFGASQSQQSVQPPTNSAAQANNSPQPAQNVAQLQLTLDTRNARWREQLVEKVTGSAKGGRQSFDISLRPKNLGEVQLRIEVADNEAKLRMVTETHSAARLLLSSEDTLSRQMDQAGLRLAGVAVQVGGQGAGFGQSFAQNSGGKGAQAERATRKESLQRAEAVAGDDNKGPFAGDQGQGRVNVLA